MLEYTTKDKQLDQWNEVKKQIHKDNSERTFKPGEVWWCKVGENVGIEANGKDEQYMRPVLIIKKLSKVGFVGIPLTTKPHDQNYWWFTSLWFNGATSYVSLAQIKTMSILRLSRKMGRLSRLEYERIKQIVANFFAS